MLRVLAVEMLEDSGFQVFEAGDGVEALALLHTHPAIALLVSDIKMPRMDGYALVEAGLGLRPDLKVLLMTGYAHDAPTPMLQAHKIRILHKPFNLELLCTLATEMLGNA
jgi:CheY-like chemotaxis protein